MMTTNEQMREFAELLYRHCEECRRAGLVRRGKKEKARPLVT
jgi:hypothetical protein